MVHYCRPRDLADALSTLAEAGELGRVLVGGTDLLVDVRRRPLEPLVLIDLKTAADLPPAIEVGAESVRFGPTATMSALAAEPRVAASFPAMVQASRVVGSVAIRNRATLIGNICNASPAADTAPALLLYGAQVTIVGPAGERTLALSDFFTGPGTTRCGPDELVISLEIPLPAAGHRSSFERLTRRRGVDLATVSAAAGVESDGAITLALGAVAPTPILTQTSAVIDVTNAAEVERVVSELAVASPISDVRATQAYREAMIQVLALRAVTAALTDDAQRGGSQ